MTDSASYFGGNSAHFGGGLATWIKGGIDMKGSYVGGNTASGVREGAKAGGVLGVMTSQLRLSGVTFEDNKPTPVWCKGVKTTGTLPQTTCYP